MDEVIFRGKTFKGKCLYGNLICKKLQNEDFDKDYADCLWRFSNDLHLVDYENSSPNLWTQITYDDKTWERMEDPIEAFYNL